MGKRFQRRKEDFICENCGKPVSGNGYTNHCPNCLFSKHVDINPGDRNCLCHGLMEPIAIESTCKGHTIVHRCQRCGRVKRNKSVTGDSFEALLSVARRQGGGK